MWSLELLHSLPPYCYSSVLWFGKQQQTWWGCSVVSQMVTLPTSMRGGPMRGMGTEGGGVIVSASVSVHLSAQILKSLHACWGEACWYRVKKNFILGLFCVTVVLLVGFWGSRCSQQYFFDLVMAWGVCRLPWAGWVELRGKHVGLKCVSVCQSKYKTEVTREDTKAHGITSLQWDCVYGR